MKKQILTGAIAASAVVSTFGLSVNPASAANLGSSSCKVGNVTALSGGNQQAASACKLFAGSKRNSLNDANFQVGSGPAGFENYINGTFSNLSGSWTRFLKSDEDQELTAPEVLAGTWKSSLPLNSPFVIVLKGGNDFAAYLFNGLSGITEGEFDTADLLNNGGNQPELSHLTVYTGGMYTPPNPIPTPALLPGLIGMGVAALRKRQDSCDESTEA